MVNLWWMLLRDEARFIRGGRGSLVKSLAPNFPSSKTSTSFSLQLPFGCLVV